MFRDYCKPALFGIFVGVLICVEARPAENNAHSIEIPNKSDSVQMLDGNLNRNRERNSDVWPWRSFSKRTSGNEPFRRPPSATAAQASDANVDSAIETRKLTSLVTGAETDVECKSQSKPLFFKSILNRLRWSDSPPSPSPTPASLLSYHHQPVKTSQDQSQSHSSTFVVSEESVQSPQPSSRLECRSQSNALNVKNTNSRPVFEYLRNDKQYEPESAAVFAPQPSSYYDLQSSASHQTGSIWHPFIQRPNVPDAEDHSIRKFHPSATASLLPNSFAYYPYSSSLDNDYYQAVAAAAAAAAAAARKSSTTEKIDLLPNKAEDIDVKDNSTANSAEDQATIDGGNLTVNVKNTQNNDTRQQWQQPLTKIILRPRASATAGKQGIAISSPISAAYVKRGDYVEIEYLPESEANVGEGGVAISRPELVIHFVDRRK